MALLQQDGILERLRKIDATAATDDILRAVHPSAYVRYVERMASSGLNHLDPDTYVVPGSYEAASASAGALVNVTKAVATGQAYNGMSLMRPPGHHALADRGMGFCLFANVAIAARYAQRQLGLDQILIIDWDVHHGNGTESIFYDDPAVAFFSTHQYPFYPGTGAARDRGGGNGIGYTLNVPFPAGVGDAGYARAFDELLTPFARRIRPDLILVSAGYDAHWDDPLAMEMLSLAGYAALARRVVALADELCNGRLVLALEGGYHLDVLAHGVLNTLRILEDPAQEISDPFGPARALERPIDDLLADLKNLHKL